VAEAGGDLSHTILGELMCFLCQVARSRGSRQSGAGRSCHPEIELEKERRKEDILLAGIG
jgi:hypothetical protein